MAILDLMRLHGQSVLVRSTCDRRNPPTALRGTIDVQPASGSEQPRVRIVLEYPDMFTAPAQQGIIELDDEATVRLLASERSGVYELAIDEELEPKNTDARSQSES